MKNFAVELNLQNDRALFMVGEDHIERLLAEFGTLHLDIKGIRIVPEQQWLEGDSSATFPG